MDVWSRSFRIRTENRKRPLVKMYKKENIIISMDHYFVVLSIAKQRVTPFFCGG